MKQFVMAVAVLAAVAVTGVVRAEEKANPTGTWKWTIQMGERKAEATLKLKLEGDKLTGAMVGRNNQETAIEDAKYKDGELSFKVVREREGQKRTSKYAGKVSGDTIKGKIESERDGKAQSRDWEAKRAK
jgi:hypothetical protein